MSALFSVLGIYQRSWNVYPMYKRLLYIIVVVAKSNCNVVQTWWISVTCLNSYKQQSSDQTQDRATPKLMFYPTFWLTCLPTALLAAPRLAYTTPSLLFKVFLSFESSEKFNIYFII